MRELGEPAPSTDVDFVELEPVASVADINSRVAAASERLRSAPFFAELIEPRFGKILGGHRNVELNIRFEN